MERLRPVDGDLAVDPPVRYVEPCPSMQDNESWHVRDLQISQAPRRGLQRVQVVHPEQDTGKSAQSRRKGVKMSWLTEWKALSAQIQGLLDAARFYVESSGVAQKDLYRYNAALLPTKRCVANGSKHSTKTNHRAKNSAVFISYSMAYGDLS
jgi:hypothetical protein